MVKTNGNATLLDVSREANVSINTAAKVIAGQAKKARISEKTAAKVLKIAKKMGYVPNMLARNLRAKRTSAVGVFIADMTESVYVASSHIILEELHKKDFLPFLTVGEIGLELCQKEWLCNRIIGLILCGTTYEMTEGFFKEIRGYGITPVIAGCAFGESSHTAGVSIVCTDNRIGIEQAITHLRERGRKNIAYISGPEWHADSHERRTAYIDRIKQYQQPLIVGLKSELQYWRRGYAAADELVHREIKFDAIIAYDDQVGIGAMKWLAEHNLKVPQDVAIVGFDNSPESEFYTPSLTTLSQSFEEIGKKSVGVLEHSIYQEHPVERIKIPPTLVIRESTGV